MTHRTGVAGSVSTMKVLPLIGSGAIRPSPAVAIGHGGRHPATTRTGAQDHWRGRLDRRAPRARPLRATPWAFERRLCRRNRFASETAMGDRWGVSGGAAPLPPMMI